MKHNHNMGLMIWKVMVLKHSPRIREHAKSLLEYWKKEKYIKGYLEYKDGRKIKGIEINLYTKKAPHKNNDHTQQK